jgi:phosphoribosyl 1,2-cyclic phosphate phosphodiesterase
MRSCAIIQTNKFENVLIDASPDLRTQLLGQRINKINSCIITHAHADHTHGLDDLRPFTFNSQTPIPIFSNAQTKAELKIKFPYIFNYSEHLQGKPIIGGGIPLLSLSEVSDGIFFIEKSEFEFFSLPHGHSTTLGICHSKMAYIVDCQEIPVSVIELLQQKNLEILIIDCLRLKPHDTHLHLDLTLNYIQQIQPKLAVLTHMGHEFDYLDLTNILKSRGASNVIPAIDGMSLLYS